MPEIERRKDYVDLIDIKTDVRTLVDNQALIKVQVNTLLEQAKKTNGRVTALEKFAYIVTGGGAVFLYLDKVLHIIK